MNKLVRFIAVKNSFRISKRLHLFRKNLINSVQIVCITTLSILISSITTLSILIFSITTLSIMIFSTKTLSIMIFSTTTLSMNCLWHSAWIANDTQHEWLTTLSIKSLYVTISIKSLFVTLSITMLWNYAQCHSLCWVSLHWVLLCLVSLRRVSLRWVSWRQMTKSHCADYVSDSWPELRLLGEPVVRSTPPGVAPVLPPLPVILQQIWWRHKNPDLPNEVQEITNKLERLSQASLSGTM